MHSPCLLDCFFSNKTLCLKYEATRVIAIIFALFLYNFQSMVRGSALSGGGATVCLVVPVLAHVPAPAPAPAPATVSHTATVTATTTTVTVTVLWPCCGRAVAVTVPGLRLELVVVNLAVAVPAPVL